MRTFPCIAVAALLGLAASSSDLVGSSVPAEGDPSFVKHGAVEVQVSAVVVSWQDTFHVAFGTATYGTNSSGNQFLTWGQGATLQYILGGGPNAGRFKGHGAVFGTESTGIRWVVDLTQPMLNESAPQDYVDSQRTPALFCSTQRAFCAYGWLYWE
jgi:hypothetical protein